MMTPRPPDEQHQRPWQRIVPAAAAPSVSAPRKMVVSSPMSHMRLYASYSASSDICFPHVSLQSFGNYCFTTKTSMVSYGFPMVFPKKNRKTIKNRWYKPSKIGVVYDIVIPTWVPWLSLHGHLVGRHGSHAAGAGDAGQGHGLNEREIFQAMGKWLAYDRNHGNIWFIHGNSRFIHGNGRFIHGNSWFIHEMAMSHSKLLVYQRKIWKVLVILIIDYRSSSNNESLLVLPEEFNSNHEEFDTMIPLLENNMLFFWAQILLFLCFTIVDVDMFKFSA